MNNRLKFKQLTLMQQTCMLCTSLSGGDLGLCAPCQADLPWHPTVNCPQCALATNDSLYSGLCGNCLSSQPHFDATKAAFTYNYPLDGLLQHYKYHASLNLARTFATLWLDTQGAQVTTEPPIDLIIPMPMHQQRLIERGFNQALELAKHFSRTLKIPLDYSSCQRIKYTPPQASLKLNQRISNIRGAFHCQPSLHNLNIALVDDVMTTGASLNELAKTLKQAGAARVECWVMARTLPK